MAPRVEAIKNERMHSKRARHLDVTQAPLPGFIAYGPIPMPSKFSG